MIKPERMSRIAIVGPRKKLDITIQCLYELNLFHVVDFVDEDPDIKIGTPLAEASEVSQKLLKLRSIIRSLRLEDYKPERKVLVEEIEQTSNQVIITLESEVSSKVEDRLTLSSRIRELQTQNEALEAFADIGLPLESLSGYENLAVFSGNVQQSVMNKIAALSEKNEVIEVVRDDGYFVIAFCEKKDADAVHNILNESGYQEMTSPFKAGTADEHIKQINEEIVKLDKSIIKADEEIESLKKKHAALVLAAEEHYSIEIQKAETPLRIATSTHSFAIDGWVPKSSYNHLKQMISKQAGKKVAIENLIVSREEEENQAPVKLKNPKIARPFELFIELMSKPLYREVDPTMFVFIVFPLFFGLMIGDFGYGACLMLAGYVMFAKLGRDSDGWKRLGYIVFAGGLFASIFGLFLFCDAFGLPFHPIMSETGEPILGGISWESAGINIPLEAHMEKLVDVKDLLAISVVAAWVHMSVGLGLGFVNERHHDRKHAAMKIIWLVILFGLFIQILFLTKGSELRNSFYMIFCSPFASFGLLSFGGLSISIAALAFILSGAVGFFVLNGKGGMMELMEILSLLSNVMSYTRIAAIGVAKGAMALAFNYIVITNFINGGNIIMIIIGAFVLVLLQLLVFALGSLSAGIQALRLNYVEFFLKFYNGGGVNFEPLGYKRKYSEKSEV